ncbi:hypothetical protein H4219_005070 [Mycoemilia scoparia]|uniref:Galactose oxidase n=1 Tax=Mycoemilia scoparia TaxID=417184 RepID=A0A9W7ZZ06_9FUNG|nr:hypothetical protein H4219_005070 [Mycoemilia scoparia]
MLDASNNNSNSKVFGSPGSAQWRTFACSTTATLSDNENSKVLVIFGGSTVEGKTTTDPLNVSDSASSAGDLHNDIQLFDIKRHKWYSPTTNNSPKYGQVLPGCVNTSGGNGGGDRIIVYANNYDHTDPAAQIYQLDTTFGNWETSTSSSSRPPPASVFGAAFTFSDYGGSSAVYMHGGIPLDGQTNTAIKNDIDNNLRIMDPSTMTWTTGSNGPARKYHTMCYTPAIKGLVMFGGADQNVDSYNDLKVYKLDTSTWLYNPSVNSSSSGDGKPSARVLHTAVCLDDKVIVFGGAPSTSENPTDSSVWVLSVANPQKVSFTWSKAPIDESSRASGPSSRSGHTAVLVDNVMYVFGGNTASGDVDRNIYGLDTDSWTWTKWSSRETASEEGGPSTGVIVAAVLSSVFGVAAICVIAFFAHRIYRRRHPKPKQPGDGDDDGTGGEMNYKSSFLTLSQLGHGDRDEQTFPGQDQLEDDHRQYTRALGENSEIYEYLEDLPRPMPGYVVTAQPTTITDSSISIPYGSSSFIHPVVDSQSFSDAMRDSMSNGSPRQRPHSSPLSPSNGNANANDVNHGREGNDNTTSSISSNYNAHKPANHRYSSNSYTYTSSTPENDLVYAARSVSDGKKPDTRLNESSSGSNTITPVKKRLSLRKKRPESAGTTISSVPPEPIAYLPRNRDNQHIGSNNSNNESQTSLAESSDGPPTIRTSPSIETLTRPASPPVPPNMQLIYHYLAQEGIPIQQADVTAPESNRHTVVVCDSSPQIWRHSGCSSHNSAGAAVGNGDGSRISMVSLQPHQPKRIMSPLDRIAQYHTPESSLEAPQIRTGRSSIDIGTYGFSTPSSIYEAIPVEDGDGGRGSSHLTGSSRDIDRN